MSEPGRPEPYDHPVSGTLTRSDLVACIRELGHTRGAALGHLDSVLDLVCGALARGEDVKLRGFGRFEVARRSPTSGRDLRTGESIPVASRNTVVFRPSSLLKQQLTSSLMPGES